jgi:hypothetical protein
MAVWFINYKDKTFDVVIVSGLHIKAVGRDTGYRMQDTGYRINDNLTCILHLASARSALYLAS